MNKIVMILISIVLVGCQSTTAPQTIVEHNAIIVEQADNWTPTTEPTYD